MKTLKGETYKHRLQIDFLRSTAAIRSCSENIWQYAQLNKLQHFACDMSQLNNVADFVIKIMQRDYPDLNIPLHSRWRHLEAGGVNRLEVLQNKVTAEQFAQAALELTIVSVLMDAGAGGAWRYSDFVSQHALVRSEGLAAASFNLFMQGLFSSNKKNHMQVDALGLQTLSLPTFRDGLQVSDKNPLVGLDGRLSLLQQLGKSIEDKSQYFGDGIDTPRLGNILKYWQQHAHNNKLELNMIFNTLLDALSNIWPGRYTLDGVNLGDVWPHSLNKTDLNPQGYVPFHKLTQWLSYSMIEPLALAGITVTSLESLTGLPEYRNGGLLVDMQVLTPKDPAAFTAVYAVDSEFIVEWRALTVALLDKLAELIRKKLNLTAQQLPLINILQGGTWQAGREIAKQLREDGSPPFQLNSDGTLF